MSIETMTVNGVERVVMDRADYEGLLAARDQSDTLRRIAAGEQTMSRAEVDAYLAARTPLAFWRIRAGRSRASLAAEADIPEALLVELENGATDGQAAALGRLARAIGVRLADLTDDQAIDG